MATFVTLTNASTGKRLDVNLDRVAFMEPSDGEAPTTKLHIVTGTDETLVLQVTEKPHEIILKAN